MSKVDWSQFTLIDDSVDWSQFTPIEDDPVVSPSAEPSRMSSLKALEGNFAGDTGFHPEAITQDPTLGSGVIESAKAFGSGFMGDTSFRPPESVSTFDSAIREGTPTLEQVQEVADFYASDDRARARLNADQRAELRRWIEAAETGNLEGLDPSGGILSPTKDGAFAAGEKVRGAWDFVGKPAEGIETALAIFNEAKKPHRFFERERSLLPKLKERPKVEPAEPVDYERLRMEQLSADPFFKRTERSLIFDLLDRDDREEAHKSDLADKRTVGGWAETLVRAPAEGAAGAIGSTLQGQAIEIERVRQDLGFKPRPVEESSWYKTGQNITALGRRMAGIREEYRDLFATDAAVGSGSLAAFGLIGMAGRGTGRAVSKITGKPLSTSAEAIASYGPAVGMAQSTGVSQAYENVQEFRKMYPELAAEMGLTDEWAVNFATGYEPRMYGAVQVASVVSLLRPLTGTLRQQTVRRMIETGFNEFTVENFGEFGQNLLRQEYDADHPIWDQVPYTGAAAGVGAAMLALLFSPMNRRSGPKSATQAVLEGFDRNGIDAKVLFGAEVNESNADEVVAWIGKTFTPMDQAQVAGGMRGEAQPFAEQTDLTEITREANQELSRQQKQEGGIEGTIAAPFNERNPEAAADIDRIVASINSTEDAATRVTTEALDEVAAKWGDTALSQYVARTKERLWRLWREADSQWQDDDTGNKTLEDLVAGYQDALSTLADSVLAFRNKRQGAERADPVVAQEAPVGEQQTVLPSPRDQQPVTRLTEVPTVKPRTQPFEEPALVQQYADVLRQTAKDAGWAEEGGKAVRDDDGNFVRKTNWVPFAQWFNDDSFAKNARISNIRDRVKAVEKAINGEPMTPTERRFVYSLVKVAQEYDAEIADAEQESIAALNDLDPDSDIPFDTTVGDTVSEQDIDAIFGFTPREAGAGQERTQAVAPGKAGATSEGVSREAQGDFDLATQTPQELRARAEAIEREESQRVERERAQRGREEADSAVDAFDLTRPGQERDIPGQGDLMDQPEVGSSPYMLANSLTKAESNTLAKYRDTDVGKIISEIDGYTRVLESRMRRKGQNLSDYDERGKGPDGRWSQEAVSIRNAEGVVKDLIEAIRSNPNKENRADLPFPTRDEDTGEWNYEDTPVTPAIEWLDTYFAEFGDLDTVSEGEWDANAEINQKPDDEIFPSPEKTVALDLKKGQKNISQEEADKRVAFWKKIAREIGKSGVNSDKVVISLFDYTGQWSQPWVDAGYQVVRHDIKTGSDILIDQWIFDRIEEYRKSGLEVYGVLSACPCTTFAVSGARWWEGLHNVESPEAVAKVFGEAALWSGAKSPLEYNQMLVDATLRVVKEGNPTGFHVLENPMGRIDQVTSLPKATLRFQPHNFGDPYSKRTQLFGVMNTDLPLAPVHPAEGSKMQSKLRGDSAKGKEDRSVTPTGFAYAFFMANDPTAREVKDQTPKSSQKVEAPPPKSTSWKPTVESVEKTIAPIAKRLKAPVVVHANHKAASESLGQNIPSDVNGFYFRGKIHIIADGPLHKSPELVEATLWHEITHAGVGVVFKGDMPRYHQAMNQMALRNKNINQAAEDWRNSLAGRDFRDILVDRKMTGRELEMNVRSRSIEEALAELSEAKGGDLKINGLRQWLNSIAQIMRRMGLKWMPNLIERLSDAEALTFITQARAAVLEAEPEATGDFADAKFSVQRERSLPKRPEGSDEVSVRMPTAKGEDNRSLDHLKSFARLNIDTLVQAGLAGGQARIISSQYPNYRPTKIAVTPEQILRRMKAHIESNILWLYDQIPQDVRDYTRRWYDGANRIANTWAERYGVQTRQVAAVMATLSPQKDWFQNASLAERVLDIWTEEQNTPWSDKMTATMNRIYAKEGYEALRGHIEGKTLGELTNNGHRAAWIRVFDEANNKRGYRSINPDGTIGDYVLTDSGNKRRVAWGSNNEIAKAVSVLVNGSDESINRALGSEHKVRNFFNNIVAPGSALGSITVDTHAVAAALLQALSGKSMEVLHNFGSGVKGKVGPGRSVKYGVSGTYALYADGYRSAAKKRGILPREMQSITWEVIRQLFSDKFKQNAANGAKIQSEWTLYREGKQSLETTRKNVWDLAGGVDFEVWRRPNARNDDPAQRSTYSREVSGVRISGSQSGDAPAGGRGRGDASGAVPPELRFSRTNLFVAHNLSESNLQFANELGGLAAPSLAIARADKGFENFGEITLLANPSLLEDRKARSFDADVYTPRQPRPEYEIDYGKWRALENSIGPLHGIQRPDAELAERGASDLAHSRAIQLGFLREIGKAPKPKKLAVAPEIRKASELEAMGPNDLRSNPDLIALAESYYAKEQQRTIEAMTNAGESADKYRNLFTNDDGSLNQAFINKFAYKAWNHKETGGIDVAAFESSIAKAMRPKLIQKQYENWIRQKHSELHSGARMFKGFNNAGDRKYSPYTLENVVKEMTKKVQGGESFNYGAGSIRAMYAQEMKSIREIQNRRDQIVSQEEMDKIRDESNDRMAQALEDLKPYYRFESYSFGYYDDASSAIAEGRKGWNETFDLDATSTKIITDLVEYLRSLPTAYFETKVGRAVDIGEFHTAVVPKDVGKDTIELLKSKGLKIVKYDPAKDGSRREAIAGQEEILFSRGKAGKRPGSELYVQASALTNDRSNAKPAEVEAYQQALEMVPDFDHDFVAIAKDKVRLLRMSSLTEPHPVVAESKVVDLAAGTVSDGRTANQIYHRMDTMVDPEHASYPAYQAVTEYQESIGALGPFEVSGKTPSGSMNAWGRQLDSVGLSLEQVMADSQAIMDTYLSGDALVQERSSSKTSRNQVAAALKKIPWVSGTRNLDIGGGKWEKGTEALRERGVESEVYDPYNRSDDHNAEIAGRIREGDRYDTVTVMNVLNVIESDGVISDVVRQAARAIKPEGTVYFSVYVDSAKQAGPTSDGYQRHQPLKDYVPFIEKWFDDVTMSGGMIQAKLPKAGTDVVPAVVGLDPDIRFSRRFPIRETFRRQTQRYNQDGPRSIISVDAKTFRDIFESGRSEKLAWNQYRTERLKELVSGGVEIDAYPMVGTSFFGGGVDVTDGRHRISLAADRGERIDVSVAAEETEEFIRRLGPENAEIVEALPPMFSRKNWYRSDLTETVKDISSIAAKDGTVKPAQAKTWLQSRQKQGKFKAEELEWSGLMDWLDMQEGRISVADIKSYLDQGGVRVREVVLGDVKSEDLWIPEDSEQEYDPADEARVTKYDNYTVPGGENYREVLLTLPQAPTMDHIVPDAKATAKYQGEWDTALKTLEKISDPLEYSEKSADLLDPIHKKMVEDTASRIPGWQRKHHTSPHWDQPNVLAHLRVDDRTGPAGEKILFVQEIQSDWAQEGRKHGFGVKPNKFATMDYEIIEYNSARDFGFGSDWNIRWEDGSFHGGYGSEAIAREAAEEIKTRPGVMRLPEAPFVTETKSWVSLALKRAIVMAVEGGYDQVAIVRGEQAAELYSLDKHLSEINYEQVGEDRYSIEVFDTGGFHVDSAYGEYSADELVNVVGKEIAQRIVDGEGVSVMAQPLVGKPTDTGRLALRGDNLKIEAKGMRDFYDKIVPQVAAKILKPFGQKVEQTQVNIPAKGSEQFDTAFLRAAENMRESGMSREQAIEAMREAYLDASDREIAGAVTVTYGGTPSAQSAITITPEMKSQIEEQGLPLFSRKVPNSAVDRQQRGLASWVKNGQPIDRMHRFLFDPFGNLIDSAGRYRPTAFIHDEIKKTLTERKLPESFGWMHTSLETARAGLIDRYGLDKEFINREFMAQAEESKIVGLAETFLKKLMAAGVGAEEAKVLQGILAEGDIASEDMKALSEPIRQAIDELGLQMVELGILDRDSYQRNLGQYLHRSYFKHETAMHGLPKWAKKVSTKRRRSLYGQELRARGLKEEVTTQRLLRDMPPDWWGRKLSPAEADKQLVNTEWVMLDFVQSQGEGTGALEGMSPKKKSRVVKRVFWPADMAIPDRLSEYTNRGTWKITDTKGKNLILRRDFSREEREQMGEILDVRYNLIKTFQILSHDIANGKFFKDIAENPEWAVKEPPPESMKSLRVADAGSVNYSRLQTFSSVDWVRVPNADIVGTKGKKKWGALAGMWVRPAIWRDLNEMDRMSRQDTWGSVLNQWKINKTARSPVVHMNNVMSNFVLMDLIDVRMQDLIRGLIEFRNKGQMWEDARDNGAFGVGFVKKELNRAYLDPLLEELIKEAQSARDTAEGRVHVLSKLGYALYSKYKTADRALVDLYQIEDEIFRMATYMRHISLGASPMEAAQIARDQFLNYDIRAPWVNALRTSVLPFISYTYRAVPAIAQAISYRPWKLAKYILLAQLWNLMAYEIEPGDEDEERRTMRQQVQGSSWMKVPFTDLGAHRMMRLPFRDQHDNPYFLDVFRWVPAGDVFDTGQGQLPLVPAWLQFGGPLQLAFELSLNRSAFTGRDIADWSTDTKKQATGKVLDYLWKAWMPSAAYIPGSWHFNKLAAALRDERDMLGRPYSVPAAIASGIGIKAQPHDVQLGYYFRGGEIDRQVRKAQANIRQIQMDEMRNIGSPESRERAIREEMEKLKRLQEQQARLVGR